LLKTGRVTARKLPNASTFGAGVGVSKRSAKAELQDLQEPQAKHG
jgi:hypothetical protein